jgi:hypothetical protein
VGAAHLDHYWLSAMFNSVSREYTARLESGKHDLPLSRIEEIAAALRVKVFKLIE